MFRSIRWRIAVPYVALILFTMLGLNVYLSDFVRQTRLDKLQAELAAEAWLVSEAIRPLLVEGASQPTLQAQLVRLAGQLDQRLTLIALDGTVLAESHADATQMENHANRPEVQQALTTGTGTSIRFSRTLGYDTFYAAARVV